MRIWCRRTRIDGNTGRCRHAGRWRNHRRYSAIHVRQRLESPGFERFDHYSRYTQSQTTHGRLVRRRHRFAGGCGTFEELLEIITWKQLGLYLNPIIILNTDGYYDPLIEMLNRATDEYFMRPEHRAMWCAAKTPQEAIDTLYSAPEWDGKLCKLAVI